MWKSKQLLQTANVYNIGYGQSVQIKDLALAIDSNIVHIPERKGEAKNTLSSYKKFCKLTGWSPSVHILDWVNSK